MNYKIDSTGKAAINSDHKWMPIDEKTQRGVKVQVINRRAMYASASVLPYGQVDFWTHWFPFPTFDD